MSKQGNEFGTHTSSRRGIATLASMALAIASVGLAPPAAASCSAPKGISGVWASNDGGDYFMRRVGRNV